MNGVYFLLKKTFWAHKFAFYKKDPITTLVFNLLFIKLIEENQKNQKSSEENSSHQ